MRLDQADEQRLRRLRRLPEGAPVLSVYMEIDPDWALHHGYGAKLLDVLKPLKEEGSEAGLDAEIAEVLAFVRDDFRPSGRSLIIFSSKPRRLWEVFALQVPVMSIARYRPRPYLAPLLSALDDYPRAAIVLVDIEKARLFSALMGEIEAGYRVRDLVPRKQRQGGWSAFKYQRDRDVHIKEHLQNVARWIGEQDRELPFERLVLGGTEDTTAALAKLLPKAMQAKLVGTFRAEMFASDEDVIKAGMRVVEEAERVEEEDVVRKLIETALAGGQAALGREETLQTLSEGRAHRLVVAAGRLGTPEADRAVTLAWDTDAELEVVHGPAEADLSRYEGLGAVLRY